MNSATPRRRARAIGIAAALGTGVVWAVFSALFGFHLGLLAVAAFGGWIIGSSVQPTGKARRQLAALLAAVAWLVGSVGDFVISQALLPAAATPLDARLSIGGYVDNTVGTFDVVQAAAIAILVIVAWRSAR
jgi:hypothetical protein